MWSTFCDPKLAPSIGNTTYLWCHPVFGTCLWRPCIFIQIFCFAELLATPKRFQTRGCSARGDKNHRTSRGGQIADFRRFWHPRTVADTDFARGRDMSQKIFFDVFDLHSWWEGPLSIPTGFGPIGPIFVDFSRFCVRRCVQKQRGQKHQNTQKWP